MVLFFQNVKLTAPAEAEAEAVAFQVLTPHHVGASQDRKDSLGFNSQLYSKLHCQRHQSGTFL